MGRDASERASSDHRSAMRAALAERGWKPVTPAMVAEHVDQPGVAMAVERGRRERPVRLAMMSEPAPLEQTLRDLAEVQDTIGAEHGLGIAGFAWLEDSERLLVTLAPLRKPLGRDYKLVVDRPRRGKGITDRALQIILNAHEQGLGPRRIARLLDEAGETRPNSGESWVAGAPRSVQAVMQTKYFKAAQDARQKEGSEPT